MWLLQATLIKILKNIFWKTNAFFWVANGTVKIKLLNDHVCSVTHEADPSALSQGRRLFGTERNE